MRLLTPSLAYAWRRWVCTVFSLRCRRAYRRQDDRRAVIPGVSSLDPHEPTGTEATTAAPPPLPARSPATAARTAVGKVGC